MLRIINLLILVLALGPFVISCSQQKEGEPQDLSEEPKDFMVKYDMLGDTEGEIVVYSQDFGKCVMEISNNKKTIASLEDEEQYVISVDLETKKGTKMLNPIYKSLIETLEAKTPKEFYFSLFETMGGKAVGEKTIIGNSCEVWELQEGLQKTCITKDGIILESESSIRGSKRGKIATELKRNTTDGVDACDPGDAEIETIDIGEMFQQQGGDSPKFELNPQETTEEPSEDGSESEEPDQTEESKDEPKGDSKE